ncbi:MMPL family transporter [Actinoplanes sp. N902-109]|uniref:MMPL family transporter n=1 Tax=Actinoplanes sp. (strain N902-109) TaxID=649831 RepID=UPI0003293A5A|nr:MMPL family transporter [Actinoplanes sp. N902-109]AGL18525.1 AlnT2 transporter [Actinoplanes sp. N902-109]
MATYLYRLGKLSFRRRKTVLALWLALVAALGIGAFTLAGSTSDSFSIPGTEAQQAQDLLAERFPQAGAGGAQARVVFAAPAGSTLTARRDAVEDVLGEIKSGGRVAAVSDPFQGTINQDKTVAYATVSYKVEAQDLTAADRAALTRALDTGRAAGLTVEAGGDALQEPGEQGAGEAIGFVVAALVLLVTFGSLVAAGLPLLTAILGVGVAVAGVQIATGFLDLSSTTPTLALMLGLAVAIDYALFIVSRYRHEIAQGRTGIEAAGRAVGTAGSAVTFAGLTVVIALAALAVVNIPFLTQMGLAAAGAVVVAVLIALTLLPALLGFAGSRVFGRTTGRRRRDAEGDAGPTAGRRWAQVVTRRPVLTLAASVLGLLVVAIPALDLRLGLPGDGTAAADTTERKAYDLLSDGFGPGFNGPLIVVVDGADAKAGAGRATTAIKALPDVAVVSPALVNPAGDTAILQVIPASAPDDEKTTDLVHAIRDLDVDTSLSVTGTTAVNIDVSARMGAALGPYLAVIVVLAFLLLTVLFRSVLVPLKAIGGFLLSVIATSGAVVAVFQWGWGADLLGVAQTGPIASLIPVLLIGIVFGLAMDYEVFLVTRMREEHVHGAAPTPAVVNGFSHGARVVTAAAIIMISVFSGFILGDDAIIKSIGFALAAAILLDAFVVRMTLVPAVMTLLGRRAWWLPRWLDRILPDVDVEGDKLRAEPETPEPRPELVGAGGRID